MADPVDDEKSWPEDGERNGWVSPPAMAWPFRLPVIRHARVTRRRVTPTLKLPSRQVRAPLTTVGTTIPPWLYSAEAEKAAWKRGLASGYEDVERFIQRERAHAK
jgi:hypothetical protein